MTTYPVASIPATEVRAIKSTNTNQEYRISVALPYSYPSAPERKYPVVYLIDANLFFGMVTEMTRMMQLCGRFPETIIVGIGYPVDEPLGDAFRQINVLRTRNLTPFVEKKPERQEAESTQADDIETGGAERFLQFIKAELIPDIEAEYRTNSTDRVLSGHSLGGLFVLYTLFYETNLFRGYVAGSPSLWYENKVTFTYEAQYAESHKTLPAKLYLGAGELEEHAEWQMVSDMIQFAARLESRNYEGFFLTKQIVANCDHCQFSVPIFQAGLSAVLV